MEQHPLITLLISHLLPLTAQSKKMSGEMTSAAPKLRAIVAGATGATGKPLVELLLRSPDVEQVTTLGRRPVSVPDHLANSPKLKQISPVDFEALDAKDFEGHNAAFCVLGTTRKSAGSAAEFERIDKGFAVNFLNEAKKSGVQHCSLLTSQGASSSSWFLYMRVKGEIEEAVKAMAFQSLDIFRPGMLGRGEAARPVEKFFGVFTSVLKTPLLAAAMLSTAIDAIQSNSTTLRTFGSSECKQIGTKFQQSLEQDQKPDKE
eukprot:m.243188 g.243188  ORF g.243188 m.243188 type:complete len:261 (+) comp15341_c0_seq1:65-847(+)